MTSRERFLNALGGQPVDRPPFWIMRQAGRYLPEYRRLKERYGFLKMVQTPDLAAEVTMLPLRRYPLDAAILFSDILVIPEALGQPYRFKDGGGIAMDWRIQKEADLDRLDGEGLEEKLSYFPAALRLVRAELGNTKALLGFGGSPWTLAAYMVEGEGSLSFSRAKAMFFEHPAAFARLLEMLSDALVVHFRLQIEAGADAIQIFDSWGAACPGALYEEMSLRWIRRIVEKLEGAAPVILFAKGMGHRLDALASSGAQALSLDWTVELPVARDRTPSSICLQGNLDPAVLDTNPDVTRRETARILESMQNRKGWIFNLGHGIHPTALPENVEALCETIVSSHSR